jgi:hypothetical protein
MPDPYADAVLAVPAGPLTYTPDPYADAVRAVTSTTEQVVRSQLYVATQRDPEAHAQALEMADSLKVPVGVVESARDQFKQAKRLDAVDVDSLVRSNPRLVAWLADHDNAVIGQDDLVHLARMDQAAEVMRRALSVPEDDRPDLPWMSGVAGRYARRGVFGGFLNVASAPFAVLEMAGREVLDMPLTEERIQDPGFSPAASIINRVDQMRAEERAAQTYRESTGQRAAGALWEMLANPVNIVLPVAGGALAARGATGTAQVGAKALTGASLVMGEQAAGAALLESMNARQARGGAVDGVIMPELPDVGNAAAQGTIGFLAGQLGGLRGILRSLNPAPMAARDLGADTAIQTAVGAGQGMASVAAAGALLPDRELPNLSQLLEEAAVGGFGGGALAFGGGLVHLRAQEITQHIQDAQAATSAAAILARAGVAMADSKAFKRSGQRVLDLLRQSIGQGDGMVYLQAEELGKVAEAAGIAPDVLRQRLGLLQEDMAEASATWAPIPVDAVDLLAEAAKAGPQAVAAVVEAARAHPDAPNLAQVGPFAEALPEQIAAIRRDVEAAAVTTEPTTADRIFLDVRQQLIDTGHTLDFAEHHGRLWAAHHGAVAYWWNRGAEAAARPRMDPWTEYQARPLRIQRGTAADLAAELAQDGGRVIRGSYQPDGNIIRLFESENLSTFSHETGHAVLERLTEVANRQGAPEVLRQDVATLREHLGNAGEAWSRQQHETWARSWEAYLMEGKAPSPALATTFARLRSWLVSVYRSIMGLSREAGREVQLPEPVRQVMDRLLATEEEITAAQAIQSQVAIFDNDQVATDLGMSAADRTTYNAAVARARQAAVDRVMEEQLAAEHAQRRAEASDAYRRIAAEVAADVDARPVYKAMATLQNRTASPGLDRAALGLPPLDLARLGRQGVLAKPDAPAVSADFIAPFYGFADGAALVRALIEAPSRERAIRLEAKARLRAEHPDLLPTATSVVDRAMRAVHGTERLEVLRLELDRLSRKVDGNPAPVEILRRIAQERVGRMPILGLKPDRWRSAEGRAAREAFQAAARGDYREAFAAKQRELASHEMWIAARNALDQVQGMQRKLVSLTEPAAQERIGLAGGWEWTVHAGDGVTLARLPSEEAARGMAERTPGATWERTSGHLEQINAILERFDLRPVTAREIQRRRSLQAWLAMMAEEGFPVDLPSEVTGDRRANWRELTVEELRGVHDAVVQIEHLARLKNKLLAAKDAADFQIVRGELAASIAAHAKGNPRLPRAGAGLGKGLRVTLDGIVGSLERFGDTVQRLDGFQDGGAAWSILKRPFDEAANRKAKFTEAATAELGRLLDAWEAAGDRGRVRDPYQKEHIPAIGQSLSRLERVMVALNWGNEGNRARVREGFNWTDGQVQRVLETLDAADAALVRGIAQLVNGYWSEIAAKQQRITGVRPEKVEGVPFTIAGEQVDGFYFPIIYDRTQSAAAALRDLAAAADMVRRGAFTAATTRRGHTKARADGNKEPLDLDFHGIARHLDQVFHDLTHHEALIDANRLLRDKEISSALEAYHGPAVLEDLTDAMQRIAGSAIRDVDGLEAGLRRMNRNLPMAAMAYNVWTAVQNVTGIFQSMERVGPLRYLRAMAPLVGDAAQQQSLRAFVMGSSDYMRRRFKLSGTNIREETARGLDAVGRETPDALRPFSMMEGIQMLVDLPAWKAAYDHALELGNAHDKAVLMADQAVVDAQAGRDVKDKAAAFEGSELKKTLTMFGSWFNATFNMSRRAVLRTNIHDPASVGRLGISFLLLYAIPTAASIAAMSLLRPNHRRDDEPVLGRIVWDTLAMMAATVPGLRELGAGIKGVDYGGPAGMRGFETLNRMILQARQMELDPAAGRAAVDMLGLATGLPSTQLQRTLDGILHAIDHPADAPRAVLFGAAR